MSAVSTCSAVCMLLSRAVLIRLALWTWVNCKQCNNQWCLVHLQYSNTVIIWHTQQFSNWNGMWHSTDKNVIFHITKTTWCGFTHTGFPLSCLDKSPGVFQDPQNVFSMTLQYALYCVCYWAYCTWRHQQQTHLTKCTVHKDAMPGRITHGMPNSSKFIVTLFQ